MKADWIGWLATALFASSYLFKQPAALRKVQAGAALLWVVYGLIIHALPVVVANLAVAGVAGCTLLFRTGKAVRGGPEASHGTGPSWHPAKPGV